VIQTALLVPEQKSTRKQLSDVAAASGTPHSSRPVRFQQPHTPRHRTGNAKQPPHCPRGHALHHHLPAVPGSPLPLRPRAHTSASPGPSSGETHGSLSAPRPASGAGEFTPSTSPMRGHGSSGAGGSDDSGGPIL
jgi:hypothetical protein